MTQNKCNQQNLLSSNAYTDTSAQVASDCFTEKVGLIKGLVCKISGYTVAVQTHSYRYYRRVVVLVLLSEHDPNI